MTLRGYLINTAYYLKWEHAYILTNNNIKQGQRVHLDIAPILDILRM